MKKSARKISKKVPGKVADAAPANKPAPNIDATAEGAEAAMRSAAL